MRHIIFVPDKSGQDAVLCRDLEPRQAAYLREHVLPALGTLSDAEYSLGPLAILESLARWSYVLDGASVLWCVEWEPGLLVLKFSPDGAMAWAALRSLNPSFGGRQASREEMEAFDEDAANPQLGLVRIDWDAQLDEDLRGGWQPAGEEVERAFDAALEHANALGERARQARSSFGDEEAWREKARSSRIWSGQGA